MRLPLAPLQALARVAVSYELIGGHEPGLPRMIADVLGTTPRQLRRWRDLGIDSMRADALAIRLGYHPAEVWPEWFDRTVGSLLDNGTMENVA